jgi:arylformamidase
MILSVKSDNQNYTIDAANPINLAIPLYFNGAQPNAYDVARASSKPCEAGELVGDTRRGGSCNFEQITFIPHCNGTHTECVGHITHERISVNDCLQDAFVLANLVSIEPEKVSKTSETYAVETSENDLMITRKAIEESFGFQISNFKLRDNPKSLIIRTLPNDADKLSKTYLREIPPFFSTEAIEFINEIGIKHLLVDLPSIDRIFDEGKLSNHRIFWNVAQGEFEINAETKIHNTITELIYVPDEIIDGNYLLNLQIASFMSDASPSRPILFGLIEN